MHLSRHRRGKNGLPHLICELFRFKSRRKCHQWVHAWLKKVKHAPLTLSGILLWEDWHSFTHIKPHTHTKHAWKHGNHTVFLGENLCSGAQNVAPRGPQAALRWTVYLQRAGANLQYIYLSYTLVMCVLSQICLCVFLIRWSFWGEIRDLDK